MAKSSSDRKVNKNNSANKGADSRKVNKNTTKATGSSYPEPYWMQRQKMKLGQVKKPAEQKKEDKKALGVFFAKEALTAPACCENCGKNLQATINFHPRAHICHIVAKGKDGCPSVATHPQNRWFGCLDCHTFYDQGAADEVAQMKVIPLLKERFTHFMDLIPHNEKRRVQLFLLPDKSHGKK